MPISNQTGWFSRVQPCAQELVLSFHWRLLVLTGPLALGTPQLVIENHQCLDALAVKRMAAGRSEESGAQRKTARRALEHLRGSKPRRALLAPVLRGKRGGKKPAYCGRYLNCSVRMLPPAAAEEPHARRKHGAIERRRSRETH